MDWVTERIAEGRQLLERLLAAPPLQFDRSIRSRLPERPGIYAIYVRDGRPGKALRAGRTRGAGGLRQRIYQNHLMGKQAGNLRAQLVRDGVCSDLGKAKAWIQEKCLVQFLVIEHDEARAWAEHFILSVLRPKYSD